MRFDDDADVPKLYFRPVRPLEEAEFDTVVAHLGSEDVTNAIEFKVFETDKVEAHIATDGKATEPSDPEPEKPKAKKKAKVTKLEPKVEEEPEIEEPTKVESKTADPEEDQEDLAAMISGWDD
jgi:hypothetical protein